METLWIYIVLMGLVTLLTVYEAVGYYREYNKGKEKKDMVKFIIKVLVLIALIIILIQMINGALDMPTSITP